MGCCDNKKPLVQYIVTDERLRAYPILERATASSAAVDLRAVLDTELFIRPGETVLVDTGLKVYIGDPGYAGYILPRSGLGHKNGIVLGNLVGLIDADYQGSLKMSIWNRGSEVFAVSPFERLAQYVVAPVVHPEFVEVTEFVATDRGEGGFGSSGKS